MKKKFFAVILIMTGLFALGRGSWLFYNAYENEKEMEETAEVSLDRLKEMIPPKSRGILSEQDLDTQMPVLEVNGLSLVGYIEIPEPDIAFAVQNQWGNDIVSRMKEGNVTAGNGVIETDRIPFDSIREGMNLSFIDVNGKVYDFIVDYIGNEDDIVQNAKLILFDEGMSKVIQIACIEK